MFGELLWLTLSLIQGVYVQMDDMSGDEDVSDYDAENDDDDANDADTDDDDDNGGNEVDAKGSIVSLVATVHDILDYVLTLLTGASDRPYCHLEM